MEISAITEKLNAPPFSKHFSLVSFDEQTPSELHATVTLVLGHINPEFAPNLPYEQPAEKATRIVGSLRVLNYKTPLSPEQLFNGILAGDHAVVYPALHWLLTNLNNLKKRAYLAKYLVQVAVPEDLFVDEGIVELMESYRSNQEEFKELHKEIDRLRENSHDPATVKGEITRLEQEKEQLESKTQALQGKLSQGSNYDAMISIVTELRKQVENDVQLKMSMRAQQEQLEAMEAEYAKVQAKLRELKSMSISGGSLGILDKLREETEANARKCREELPRELEARRERESLIRSSLSMSASEGDVSALQRTIGNLEKEVSDLRAQRDNQRKGEDKNLTLYRQQSAMVAKKKQEITDRRNALIEERKSLEHEIKEQEKKFEGALGGGGTKILKGEQFTKYAASLRTKNEIRKNLKTELSALRSELGILSRTEQLLANQKAQVDAQIDRLERERGVHGYQELRTTIEKVSKDKADIDMKKGATLEEISRIVEKINNSIKEKKALLAPLVKNLRATRQTYQDVETEYNEKKSVYDNVKAGLETKMSDIVKEVTTLRAECSVEESRYHFLNCLNHQNNILLRRAKDEQKNVAKAGNSGKGWIETYKKRLVELETETRRLKDAQRNLASSHEPNMRQLDYFRDVKKLLKCKMDSLRAEMNNGHSGGYGADYGTSQRFVLDN